MKRRSPFRSILALAGATAVATTAAASARAPGAAPLVPPSQARLVRAELHLAPGARTAPHIVLMTLGGPVYCLQLALLARALDASRLCLDYGPNRYEGAGERAARKEDWGDPAYLAAAARVPSRLRASGVNVSKLVLVGVSYSGFANAELVATHPELRPDALVVVDSYLDLPARYQTLPASHETRREIESVIGGTLAQLPAAYAQRSPSDHLDGLADAIRHGMRFVDVWSVSAEEKREFNGATCSRSAHAQWLSELAGLLGRPVVGYVTQMQHAHALWDRGREVLALAGVASGNRPFVPTRMLFRPGRAPQPGSYCGGGLTRSGS
jgi:pimeloyl-ACP methyl ester carboxylesterase